MAKKKDTDYFRLRYQAAIAYLGKLSFVTLDPEAESKCGAADISEIEPVLITLAGIIQSHYGLNKELDITIREIKRCLDDSII